ncbi:hypothetical protein [Micromonospora sp. DT231]|uniref:hypothetical protein n=1 Tax=Micromonospora sp. DT231 TaxID=3416526 RepID=UPI003CF069FE
MSKTRAALIVIDMQNGFLNDRSRGVIPKVVELVEHWEAIGRLVMFTRAGHVAVLRAAGIVVAEGMPLDAAHASGRWGVVIEALRLVRPA